MCCGKCKKKLCHDVTKYDIPKNKRLYIFIFIFFVFLMIQVYIYSIETKIILNHGSLFIEKNPIIVTEATETDKNDLNKLLSSISSIDPSRRVQIYVEKEKSDWWKIYEDLINIEVIDLKVIKNKANEEFKIFIFPILLNSLKENDYSM